MQSTMLVLSLLQGSLIGLAFGVEGSLLSIQALLATAAILLIACHLLHMMRFAQPDGPQYGMWLLVIDLAMIGICAGMLKLIIPLEGQSTAAGSTYGWVGEALLGPGIEFDRTERASLLLFCMGGGLLAGALAAWHATALWHYNLGFVSRSSSTRFRRLLGGPRPYFGGHIFILVWCVCLWRAMRADAWPTVWALSLGANLLLLAFLLFDAWNTPEYS